MKPSSLRVINNEVQKQKDMNIKKPFSFVGANQIKLNDNEKKLHSVRTSR